MPDESGASAQAWQVMPFEDEWWLYHTSGEALIADKEAKARRLADHLNATGWRWPPLRCGDLQHPPPDVPVPGPPSPPSPICLLDAGHEGRHQGRTMHGTVTW